MKALKVPRSQRSGPFGFHPSWMDETISGEPPFGRLASQIQRINCSYGYKIFSSERWAKSDRTARRHGKRTAVADQLCGPVAAVH